MKKKQVLSMGLAASLALCLAAPAVQAEETEGVTLTIAVGQHSSDVVEDFNEKYAIKEACEATGINVEWIPILEGDAGTEQVAVRLAGDMPDVFIGLMTDTLITDNASLFVPLEDMIEEYCPNIYATYTESVDGWEDYLTYPDGHIYSLMGNYMASYNNFINGTMWINQTWLDNCGLEMPTTMEELEQVLIAFRDMDADGDGDTEDEIPMDFCQKHYAARYYELAHCFGLPIETKKMYDIVDGTVTSIADSDALRECLEYYNYLCTEGLANIEGPTQTEEQYTANIANGDVGVFWGWAPYTYTSDADLQAQYVPVSPISAEGYTFRVQPTRMTANRNCFVITTACENVEAALTFWDYLSRDQEAANAARSGPEGLTWEMVDGVATARAYTPEEATEYGYESIAGHAGTSTFAASMGLTNCPPLILSSLAAAPGTTSEVRENAVKLYEEYFTEQSMSKAVVPSDVQEEFDFTCEGLEDYVNAFASDAIINGVTDESWSAYVAGLEEYSYDYYIEFYQNYLDGTF